MTNLIISSNRLDLILLSTGETLAIVEAFTPEVRAQVSPVWLAMVTSAKEPSPWIHGFRIVERQSGQQIGTCGFKGPPSSEGIVELAYGIEPTYQGQGYATEAAQCLTDHAVSQADVRSVRAHTLTDNAASQRVLDKCGFQLVGEVDDPEDGIVLRWQYPRIS